MNNSALFSSNSDEWATPQDVFQELNAEFHFTLDPCATDQNHKCAHYYTQADNGLQKDWGGNVYSAILPTVPLRNGSASVIWKESKRIQSLFF